MSVLFCVAWLLVELLVVTPPVQTDCCPCSAMWPGLMEVGKVSPTPEEEVKVRKRGKCKINLIICATAQS